MHRGDYGIAYDDCPLERAAHCFYPTGNVDGIADDREFESSTGPDIPEHYFAKMQANAQRQLGGSGGGTPPVPRSESTNQAARAYDGVSGIVSARPRRTEGGHHAIAYVLVESSLVAEDGILNDTVKFAQDCDDLLAGHIGAERRVVDEIGEQDRRIEPAGTGDPAPGSHDLVDHFGREIARPAGPLPLRLGQLLLERSTLGDVAQSLSGDPRACQRKVRAAHSVEIL